MEAINYANGSNMTLPEDAQIVQGISGNAVYLPAGAGTMPIAGNRNELTISLWRQWDGVVEADDYRGVFSTANIKAYFDQATDFLTVELAGAKTVTDIKDDQEQTHWCFLFSKNGFFKIYKNAELKAELTAGNYPVDFSEGFTLGGGRTHATFDEVRKYKTVVTEPEISGLYRLVTKGTQVQQLENIVAEAAPKYLGVVETVPDTKTVIITKGEKFGFVDANPGDWVLSGKTIGGWKVGVCYKWSGLAWKPLEPAINYAKEYHACLVHLFEIEELKRQTGHFGALFAQMLVTQEAFIKKLSGDIAFLNRLIVKKLHIDTIEGDEHNDFEAWFDETNGLKIRNKGEEIFKVDTNGDVFAKNAFLQDGTFIGEIKNKSFQVLKRDETDGILFEYPNNTKASTIFNNKGEGEWNVSGKYGENMVSAVKISSYWEHLEDGADLPIGKEKKYKHWHGIKFSFENKPSITFSFGTIEWWYLDYNTNKETYMSTVSSWDDTIPNKMKLYQQNLAPENIFFPQLSEAIPNKPSQVFFQRINGRKVLCIT